MPAAKTLLVTSALLSAAVPAGAQKPAAARNLTTLDAYISQAVRDWHIPGLAIAIVKDDSVVFAKGYGVRELGKAEAVDVGTRFAIGSTTKAMTAAAVAMLVDSGKVRWDDPVTRYLPDFRVGDPYVTRELTVRDLLTHRGGMGNADQLWTQTDYSTDEVIRRFGTIQPAYSLRSRFVYQNIMYAVAGEVVAAASGMSWDAFVRTRILAPLDMTETETTLAALAGKPNVATPHGEIRDTIRPIANRPVDAVAAAGSIWSSVEDMAKWMRFVLDSARVDGKRLISAANFQEMMTPQTIASRDLYATLTVVKPHFFTYGFGWFLHDYSGEAVAMHTGSIDGMSALIGLIPERRLGVYVLANLDHAELRHALMYRVFDLYSGNPPRDWSAEFLTLFRKQEEQAAAQQRQLQARRAADTHPSLPLDRYAGTYVNQTYGSAVVSIEDGKLHFAFGRLRPSPLTHWQYDTFQAKWSDERMSPSLVVFTPDGTGGVSSVRAFGMTFTRR